MDTLEQSTTIKIPEKNKQPGVCYAVSNDGIELPVIDVTHPAFVVDATDEELATLSETLFREEQRRRRVPAFIRRLLLRLLFSRSILGRGIVGAGGTFLSGMNTYLMKLGPQNLGEGYAREIDRKIADSLPCLSMRLRLQHTSHLLADGLAPALASSTAQTVLLLNIGGGPAVDSMGALIIIQKQHPEWLCDRTIVIQVLDIDRAGPDFGARAWQRWLRTPARSHA